jgi:hypothetical protein
MSVLVAYFRVLRFLVLVHGRSGQLGPRLMSFIGFCEARGATTVTTDLAVEWVQVEARDIEDPLMPSWRFRYFAIS